MAKKSKLVDGNYIKEISKMTIQNPTARPSRLILLIIVLSILSVLFADCSSTNPTSQATAKTSMSLPKINSNDTDASGTMWLCNPEIKDNPCLSSLSTAVKKSNNVTVTTIDYKPDYNAPIDCFYVYPTVSAQPTGNAAERIGPSEKAAAYAQASMFSRVCKVYAPIYRQVTLRGLFGQGNPKPNQELAYTSLLSAFEDYIHNFNDNRGFVLLGHSQGSFILTKLIQNVIDNNPSLRKRLVSAILLGGNLVVPIGKTVGGSFKNIPTCQSKSQTGCLIAYSSFPSTPPANSLFGRTSLSGDEVVCVNPSALSGGSAVLQPLSPTHLTLGLLKETGSVPNAKAAWVTYPNYLIGQCEYQNGASYLQITENRIPNDQRLSLSEALGPTWGYHVYDMNVDLNALVNLVSSESSAYAK